MCAGWCVMTGSLGRVTGRESGRVGGVGTVQENEGFGSHPAVTTKPSFSLHASRVTRLKGGCAPKKGLPAPGPRHICRTINKYTLSWCLDKGTATHVQVHTYLGIMYYTSKIFYYHVRRQF